VTLTLLKFILRTCFVIRILSFNWALVTHVYNPSYSGSRDQEDCGSKPAKIVCETLPGKKHHKTGLVELLKVQALSSSPSTAKINK
jgi:hypothetical protein